MKPNIKPLATALAATLQLTAIAAVPLAWDVRPGQPAPVMFDRYHGEMLSFSATFRGFGELPFSPGADIRLWFQTNGMGSAWWSAPATIQSNVLSATWAPALDPGADRVSLFFGAPSNAYAAAVLRLRHSPGFAPGTMPDPESFHESDPVFAAWLSTNALMTVIADTARAATNYTDALNTRLSLGYTQVMSAQYADSAYDSRRVYDEDAERSYTATDLIQASTNAARAATKDALGAFAETGTVERARSYGTATRWVDSTGCVWETGLSFTPWSFSDGIDRAVIWGEYYDELGWPVYGEDVRGTDSSDYGWFITLAEATNVTRFVYVKGDGTEVTAMRTTYETTNLCGRVAMTNDVPEWPAELVHTHTPLIFADGQDTNVTSLALRAQPENYTSLSFLSPVSYYLPNRFSLLELGHDYQIAAAQWLQVGRYLYLQAPENIVFVGGGQHRSFQDYLDACSPQTMADLLSCYIPTNGGGRIHGDLTIDGRLTAGELITITNSDIHAKGFQVVNKVLTADGLLASNGMVRLNCARFALGFGTPRIHLETDDLSAITYGGTWEHPAGSVFSWQDERIAEYLAGNAGQQDIELRNPYVRYMDVQNDFVGWKIKDHNVNNGPLKHFTLDNYRTHHFTDADVGNYGIEFTISSNADVRLVYDFASAPPSAVYFYCGRDGNDQSATMLSNGTELLVPTAGTKTLLEIKHLSDWTFIVKETPLTYENSVRPWVQALEEEP